MSCIIPIISDHPDLLAIFVGSPSSIPRTISINVNEKSVRMFIESGLPERLAGDLDSRPAQEDNPIRGGDGKLLTRSKS